QDQLTLDFELKTAALFRTSAGSSMQLSAATAWSAPSSSFPGSNFTVGQEAIRATTGYRANTLIVAQRAFDVLNNHPDVVRHGIGGNAVERLASIAAVASVYIASARVNLSQEGQPLNSFSDVWSTQAFLVYVPPTPALMVPSFAYAFRWTRPNVDSPGT